MTETAKVFYEENNLQDMNAYGLNFTENDLEKIKSIQNVKNAERKSSITATTDNDNTLLLNIIETNKISKFYVIDGEGFSNKDGIWLDNFYAIENNIKVGDRWSCSCCLSALPKSVGAMLMPSNPSPGKARLV